MTNSVRQRFIEKIRTFQKIEHVPKVASVYSTFNEIWLYVLYSSLTKGGYYWFGVDTYKTEEWKDKRRFIVCFICGDENTVVFLPDEKLFEWYSGVKPNRKGHWMVIITPKEGKLFLRISADRPSYDLTEYLNRYDFISKSIPPLTARMAPSLITATSPLEEVQDLIMDNQELAGNSLHDKIISMLAQIGKWAGYIVETSYRISPDSPYEIDVVWLRNDMVDVAIEVQVRGKETEAKDRLIHAKRFGARKIIVVSVPESVSRLKSLC